MEERVNKDDIMKYLKNNIEEQTQNHIKSKIDLEKVKQYNTFILLDKIFPLHILFKTKDTIPYLNIDFLSTYRYMHYLRINFVNLLNAKFNRKLNNEEIIRLKKAERKYYYYNFGFYFTSLIFLLRRPIKVLKILNIYIALYLIVISKYYSIFMIRNSFIDLRNKLTFDKNLMNEIDVYDYTLIPDWRTYLYYYKIL
jgi:hypothetical protein